MAEPRRYLYPLAALAATVALGWWIVSEPGPPSQPQPGDGGDQPPRYYATEAMLRHYAAEGPLNGRVQAKRMQYFEANDQWQFTQPRWQRLSNDSKTRAWQGRGDRGTLTDEESVGRLSGDVVLTTPGRNGPIRFHTDYLRLRPNRDYAETDAPVRIQAPRWEQKGKGGEFWLAEQRYHLLAETEAFYEATSSER